MKKSLLMAACFAVVSNCYALKSPTVSIPASNSMTQSYNNTKYLGTKQGPDSKGRVYSQISTYNKKDVSQVEDIAVEIASFVCANWAKYNIDSSALARNIKEAAPQYLKKWKRHYLYVYTPSKVEGQKLSKVQSFLKKDDSGLNGRIWSISNNTPGESMEYIVEMQAKHNIFKSTGKNLTFKIYKNIE